MSLVGHVNLRLSYQVKGEGSISGFFARPGMPGDSVPSNRRPLAWLQRGVYG